MNDLQDSDLLLRVASADTAALSGIYDRHASAVYGYALLITRSPRAARRVVIATFAGLARQPERASTSGNLRRPLLALARPIAYAERPRRRWFRKKGSYALAASSPPDVLKRLDAEPEEVAEGTALHAVEGIGVHDLQTESRSFGSGVVVGTAWRAAPGSLRALALMKATDAARPSQRYLRWFAIWAVFTSSVALAFGTQRATPAPPPAAFISPQEPVGKRNDETTRKRRGLLDLIDGLHREVRK
jgi:DNA-directed RNA polymerase specialized sigma24 family protein